MIDDSEVSDWVFDFNLSEKIEYFENVVDLPNLTFKKSEKNVTGCIYTVKNSTFEDAEKKYHDKSRNLKYILTIKSGMPIDIYLKGYHSIPKEGNFAHVSSSFRNSYRILGGFKNLDLSSPEIHSILTGSESKNLKYQYLAKAIFHYFYGNSADCIKEIFKLISENSQFPNYEKLKVLRDIFSHKPQYVKETMELFLKHFDSNSFDYRKYDPDNCWIIIDLESNKNVRTLNKLSKDSIEMLRNELKLPRL